MPASCPECIEARVRGLWRSNPFVDKSEEEPRIDNELPPPRVERCCWLCLDDLFRGQPLCLECGNIRTDGNQHFPEFDELSAVTDRTVAGHDDGPVGRHRNICVGRA